METAVRVAEDGSAIDPEVVAPMVGRRRKRIRIAELGPRELDVRAAMPTGTEPRH